jgi:hypothetical protein
MDNNNETVQQIIKRLRRKIEVMRLDQKANNSLRHHDSSECLTLLDMLERNLELDK